MDAFRLVKLRVVLCVLGLACPATIWAADEPLQRIFCNLPLAENEQEIWDKEAKKQSKGDGPLYLSQAKEEKDFLGLFVAADKDPELWVFSDDGVNVSITDYSVPNPKPADPLPLKRKNQPQHLPSWKKESLHKVDFPFRAHKVYGVRVEYSNIIYHGTTDIDGCTLFAIKGGGQLVPVSVTFDPDPVKTGFTVPLATSTIARSVTGTVVPKEATKDVVISSLRPPEREVLIEGLRKNPETGKITFDVKGLKETEISFPEGSTTIRAKYAGEVVGEVKAVVYVPKIIHTPLEEADGDVTPINFCADYETSPLWAWDVPADHCALITHWSHWMTVTVDDQWGNTLNDIYQGVAIEEFLYPPPNGDRDPEWWDINVDLSDSGTYQDPVGLIRKAPDYIVPKSSEAARDWPPPPPPPTLVMETGGYDYPEIKVRVGGHEVGKIKRRIIWTPPNHINVKDMH